MGKWAWSCRLTMGMCCATIPAMKQHVEITMKLNLWLPAEWNEEQIITHIRSSLPTAFGEHLTDMENPVDVLDVREEAEIYCTNS